MEEFEPGGVGPIVAELRQPDLNQSHGWTPHARQIPDFTEPKLWVLSLHYRVGEWCYHLKSCRFLCLCHHQIQGQYSAPSPSRRSVRPNDPEVGCLRRRLTIDRVGVPKGVVCWINTRFIRRGADGSSRRGLFGTPDSYAPSRE